MIQWLAISGSIIFILLILELIRKKRIREEFSLIWLLLGIILFVLSVWRDSLEIFAGFIGISYAPAALFLTLIVVVISILIHFSIVISRLTDNQKDLVQEVGLLRMYVDELKLELKNAPSTSSKGNSLQASTAREQEKI